MPHEAQPRFLTVLGLLTFLRQAAHIFSVKEQNSHNIDMLLVTLPWQREHFFCVCKIDNLEQLEQYILCIFLHIIIRRLL